MSSVQTQCLVLWTAFLSVSAPPLKVLKPNGDCLPGELVWVECNLCTCNTQGKPNPVCAAMWCQPVPTTSKPHNQKIDNIVQSGPRRNTTHHIPPPPIEIISSKIPNNLTEIVNNNLQPIESTTNSGSSNISPSQIDHSIDEQ